MMNGFRRLQIVSRAGAEKRKVRAMRKYNRAATVIQCFVRCRWAYRELRQLRIDARNVDKVKIIVEDLKVKLSESAGKWKSEKVALIAEFKSEYQELSESLQAVEKELATANGRVETLTEDLRMTTEDFQELDSEFAEYRENNSDKEYAEALEIDLNTVRDDLRQARERADLLEKDNIKISEMKALTDKLQDQVTDLEKRESDQSLDLLSQKEKYDSLRQDYDKALGDLEDARAEVLRDEDRLVKLAAEKETEVSEKVLQMQSLEKELHRSLEMLKECQKQQQQSQDEMTQTMESLRNTVQQNVVDLETFEKEKVKIVNALESNIASLQDELDASKLKTVELSNEVQTVTEKSKRDLANLQGEFEGVKGDLKKKNEEVRALLEEARVNESELADASKKSEFLERRISSLENDVANRDSQIESLGNDFNKAEKNLGDMQRQCNSLEDDKRNLQKSIDSFSDENKEMTKGIESLRNEIKLKDEVFALREKTLESGSENLLKKIEEKQRQCDSLESERNDVLQELERTKVEMQKKLDYIKSNEQVIHDLQENKKLLTNELNNAKEVVEANKKIISDLQNTKEESVSKLTERVRNQEAQVTDLKNDKLSREQELRLAKQAVTDRDSTIEQLENDMKKVLDNLDDKKHYCEKLEKENQSLENVIQDLSKEKDVLADGIKSSNVEKEELVKGIEGEMSKKNELANAMEKLRNEKEELDEFVTNLNHEKDELTTGMERLNNEKEELIKDAENLRSEIKMKDEMFAKREQALESSSDNLLKDIEERERQCESIEAERNAMREELGNKNEECLKEKGRAEALEEDLVNARQENDLIKQNLQDIDAESSAGRVKELEDALREKTAELNSNVQEHLIMVEALEDKLMAVGEELANVKEQRQQSPSDNVKHSRVPMASSRLRGSSNNNASDEILSDSDMDGDMEDDIGKVQEKYVEKRAEVETLHIGLDSLLEEYKNSQQENHELVEILKSRDDMLLESVAVLEDRDSAIVQIKTLEDGVDNILQELAEVKAEKDQLQNLLDDATQQQANLRKRLEDADRIKYDYENEQRIKDETLSNLKVGEMRADVEKSVLLERVNALQNDLAEANAQCKTAREEAAALSAKLHNAAEAQALSGYRNDVSDLKSLVKNLEDGLKAAVQENTNQSGRDDEYKESDIFDGDDDDISEHIERGILKCQQMSDWLIEEAGLSPSDALNYSTFIVQDGVTSVKRLRKIVKKNCNYATDLGINDRDAAAIVDALGVNTESARTLYPVALSPSAPRQYMRSANGRLSFSPSVLSKSRSVDDRSLPLQRHPKISVQSPHQESHEEKKDRTEPISHNSSRLALLEAQASEAARIAASASEEADRIAQLYSKSNSTDDMTEEQRKIKRKELRRRQEEVVKAQENAYIAATRARDAFLLATAD